MKKGSIAEQRGNPEHHWSDPGRVVLVSDATRPGGPFFFYILKGGDIMPELLTTVMQVVGSLGFPIVMCILLYNHLNEVQKQHTDDLKAEREEHRNEIKELKDVINELKITLVSIRTIIGGSGNGSGN